MNTLLQNPAGAALVALLLKATAIVAVAALAQFALRRHASAAARHGVWALTVAGLLLLPALSATGPQWPVQIDLPAADRALMPSASPSPAGRSSGEPTTIVRREAAPTPSSSRPAPSAAAAIAISWPLVALAVYTAGALLLVARLIVDHAAARRLVARSEDILDAQWTAALDAAARALGVTRRVRLLRAPAHVMPMVVGLRRPAILVSDDADAWTAERRRSVILHEMAHVERRDCLTQTLASLARAIYWPHPGVWWAARRLQVEREFACDDRVLGAGTEADGYANDLLEIAYTLGARRAPALAVTMARRGQLEGRLLAVLDAARNRATPGVVGRAASTVAAIAVLVPVAAIGVTTHAASLPMNIEDYAPSTASHGSTVGGQPATPAQQPGRLPKTLYAWRDVIEETFSTSGTWSVQPSEKAGQVYFEMRQLHSSNGHTVPLSQLEGLTPSQMNAGGTVKFLLRRDAGTFTCEGVFRDGVGGGAFSYAANPGFPDELARRGVSRPTARQQFEMAKNDVSLGFLDDLKAQGYQMPTAEELVQASQHGVSSTYVRDMGALGYKVGTVAALIKLRDHGVTPDYVGALRNFGFGSLSVDELVNARDHGVSADYVTAVRELGYKNLTLEELINGRDHGVSADYIRELQALGYKADFKELMNARDHGVTADYIKGLKDLGYTDIPLVELRNLRDHGATPERVKHANDKAGTKLSPEMLRTVLDGGLR